MLKKWVVYHFEIEGIDKAPQQDYTPAIARVVQKESTSRKTIRKEKAMIKAFTGFKVKKDADIFHPLLKIRGAAIQYPGYISAENLQNLEDSSKILVLSTWQTLEAWRLWEKSKIRTGLYRTAETLFVDEPRVSVYEILATKS